MDRIGVGRQHRGTRVEGWSRRRSRRVGASSEGIQQGSEARSRGRAAIEARTLAVDVASGSPRASTVLSGSNFLTSSSAMASSRICFANRATASARHVVILRRLVIVAALQTRLSAEKSRCKGPPGKNLELQSELLEVPSWHAMKLW